MRTETVTREIFQFDELSDSAKEKARDWYRAGLEFYDEHIIEMAATAAELFGLDIRTTRKAQMGGGHHYAPTVYFSGFSSQGDGACFEGNYRYKKGALKAVKTEFPTDGTLHGIVQRLQDVQRRNFYQLAASCKHRGRYYHSGYMSVDVERLDGKEVANDAETDLTDALRDFANWIYSNLESEYDYQNSDAAVDKTIRANDYEFTAEGRIA